ncbi:MAG: YHYH protein [Planctomycetes bacterium]|nr:YHYH protein [Planctomycetota bacterium]
MLITSALLLTALSQGAPVQLDAFKRNLDGSTGQSTAANIHAAISQIESDVQRTSYTPAHVFVESAGIPSHAIGPWPGNPNVASDQSWSFLLPVTPTEQTGAKTATGLGAIGVMVNGVPIFNAKDARSYQNANVWFQNAIFWEGATMDTGMGHPAMRGDYHYHQIPHSLVTQTGDTAQYHSSIIGFAFDGFPIYGPYGFANANGSGAVVRMETSYRMRNITDRHTLPDGTVLSQNEWGPAINNTYPLGAYNEDYEYISGLGHLNEYNGRICVTPEYPQGTFAYFATRDAAGEAEYPYLVGPNYYGVLETLNTGIGGGHLPPPPTATVYEPFEIGLSQSTTGGNSQLAIAGAPSNVTVQIAYSLAGMDGINTPYGVAALSMPATLLPPMQSNAQGNAAMPVTITPNLAGVTVYMQAVSNPGTATGMLSLPERVTIL